MSTEVLKARSRIGVATRRGTPEDVAEARRDYRAVKLEAHIREVVNAAPPLTDEQADRLAALIRTSQGVA